MRFFNFNFRTSNSHNKHSNNKIHTTSQYNELEAEPARVSILSLSLDLLPGCFPLTGCATRAKILRSIKRMTKFLEKKQEALSVTILPSIDIYPLAKPISLSPTFSVNIWPSEFLPIDPQPDNQPIAAKTLPNSEPLIPEPHIPEPLS